MHHLPNGLVEGKTALLKPMDLEPYISLTGIGMIFFIWIVSKITVRNSRNMSQLEPSFQLAMMTRADR